MKKNSPISHFVRKKIISSHSAYESSVFATFLSFKIVRRFKMCQVNKQKTAGTRTCELGTWVTSYNLERRKVSPQFCKRK